MIEEEIKGFGIDNFDRIDFGYYRMQIENYLYGKKLYLLLLGEKCKDMSISDWKLFDKHILGVIRLTLSRSIAHSLTKKKTIRELMATLFKMYEKSSANNKVYLMKKLFNLKMVEGKLVTQHLKEFNIMTNQLSFVEIDFDDEIRAMILLASLPNS